MRMGGEWSPRCGCELDKDPQHRVASGSAAHAATGLAARLHQASTEVGALQGLRWTDLTGESGDKAQETIDKEVTKFAKALRYAVDQLHETAEEGAVFDGELAFRCADTPGYPVELAAEEAARIGMTVDPDWPERYEVLREDQRARSRG